MQSPINPGERSPMPCPVMTWRRKEHYPLHVYEAIKIIFIKYLSMFITFVSLLGLKYTKAKFTFTFHAYFHLTYQHRKYSSHPISIFYDDASKDEPKSHEISFVHNILCSYPAVSFYAQSTAVSRPCSVRNLKTIATRFIGKRVFSRFGLRRVGRISNIITALPASKVILAHLRTLRA